MTTQPSSSRETDRLTPAAQGQAEPPIAGTLYEHIGGHDALQRLVAAWYPTVLTDPELQPLFGSGHRDHVPHLTAFFAEVFGGPAEYTEHLGGFPQLLSAHRDKSISEHQRVRFVELFLAALDASDIPNDERTRRAFVGYLEFGTQVAAQNSLAVSDDGLHPCQEVPRWSW